MGEKRFLAGQKVLVKDDPGGWFDPGTVAELLADCSCPDFGQGIFLGLRNGEEDEELCPFEEFEEMAQ